MNGREGLEPGHWPSEPTLTLGCAVHHSWGLPPFPQSMRLLAASSPGSSLVISSPPGRSCLFSLGTRSQDPSRPGLSLATCSNLSFLICITSQWQERTWDSPSLFLSHSKILTNHSFPASLLLSFSPLSNCHTSFKANSKSFLLQEACLDFPSSHSSLSLFPEL